MNRREFATTLIAASLALAFAQSDKTTKSIDIKFGDVCITPGKDCGHVGVASENYHQWIEELGGKKYNVQCRLTQVRFTLFEVSEELAERLIVAAAPGRLKVSIGDYNLPNGAYHCRFDRKTHVFNVDYEIVHNS